jgi:Putative polyhydroxyalkanoic acid system protein (PHA_gran_rgn)
MANVTVPHRLGKDEAKHRLSGLLPGLRREFAGMISDLQERWEGDALQFGFKARGFSVTGAADVRPDVVSVDYNLPLLARPFKGQFESGIRERLGELLA